MTKYLNPQIVSLLFLYLLGSFVETSFDITLWRQSLREVIAVFSLPFLIASFGFSEMRKQ